MKAHSTLLFLAACHQTSYPPVIENRYTSGKDDPDELAWKVKEHIAKNGQPMAITYTGFFPRQLSNAIALGDRNHDKRKDLIMHIEIEGMKGIITLIDHEPLGSLDVAALGNYAEDVVIRLPTAPYAQRAYHGFLRHAVSFLEKKGDLCCDRPMLEDITRAFIEPALMQAYKDAAIRTW